MTTKKKRKRRRRQKEDAFLPLFQHTSHRRETFEIEAETTLLDVPRGKERERTGSVRVVSAYLCLHLYQSVYLGLRVHLISRLLCWFRYAYQIQSEGIDTFSERRIRSEMSRHSHVYLPHRHNCPTRKRGSSRERERTKDHRFRALQQKNLLQSTARTAQKVTPLSGLPPLRSALRRRKTNRRVFRLAVLERLLCTLSISLYVARGPHTEQAQTDKHRGIDACPPRTGALDKRRKRHGRSALKPVRVGRRKSTRRQHPTRELGTFQD